MKRTCLSIVALVVVAGCAEQPIPSAVRTPAGSKSSVRVVALRANDASTPLTSTAKFSVWVEHAYASSVTPYDTITAYWTVPSNPHGSYGDSTTHVSYSTFPALENRQRNAILQPILQFTAEYTNVGQWTLVNTHCYTPHLGKTMCIKDWNASKHALPGDVIYGSVSDTLCDFTHTNCTWRVLGLDAAASDTQADRYTDSAGPFFMAIGGAVEVDTITQCSQYPFGGVFYHGVYVSAGGQRFAPAWTDTVTNGITPWCSFGVYSHLDTVNLYHNYPPPARLTVSIIGPSTVRPNVPCLFTAVHTGGTPPLTYGWRPSGTQEDSSVIEQFASDSYLYLTVVDSLNQWAYNSMLVRVTPSAPVCPYAPVR